jgi:hypothetical protein
MHLAGGVMADEKLDPFIGIPKTLTRKHHRDFRGAYVLTYAAVRSFASLEPASENFSRCFPGIPAICAVFGQARRTVFDSLRWLEANDYLYRHREHEQRGSSIYALIVRREWFQEVQRKEGRAEAISRYETWILEWQAEARAGRARKPRQREGADGIAQPSRDAASKYPPVHYSPGEMHGGNPDQCTVGASIPACTQIKIQELGVTRIRDQHSGIHSAPEVSLVPVKTLPDETEEEKVQEQHRIIQEGVAGCKEMLRKESNALKWPKQRGQRQ